MEYEEYQRIMNSDTLILKYESLVYKKKEAAISICQHFDIAIGAPALEAICIRHDFIPETENPNAHIRNVHPNDHLNKLSKETISTLSKFFDRFNVHYGYA